MKKLAVALAAGLMLLGACGSDSDSDKETSTDTTSAADAKADATDAKADATDDAEASENLEGVPTITVGIQDFGESKILAQIYGQAIADAGYTVKYQEVGGYRDVEVKAFESGDINFAPEYAASLLEFLNEKAGEATPDAEATMTALAPWLDKNGLAAGAASAAIDSNAFVVTKETSEAKGLTKISQLTSDMTLGGPQDCPTNPFCIAGLQSVYGIDLSANFVPLDGAGSITKKALEQGDVDVALLFSTDGTIAEKGWVVLEDDKALINADVVVPVFASDLVDADGAEAFRETIDKVSAALTTEKLTAMNKRFDVDHEDADAIASDFLADEGLVG